MKKLSPKTVRKLILVRNITIAYTLIGLFFGFYDAVVYDLEASQFVIVTINNSSFALHMFFSTLGPFLGGIVGGFFLVFVIQEWFRKMPYGRLLITNSIIYLAIIGVLIAMVTFVSLSYSMGRSLWDPVLIEQAKINLLSLGFLKFILLWYIFTTLTLVALQVNDKYGQGVFRDLLMGKYHRPRTEFRIFMFLDLNKSTTVAEQIGHAKYFELLRYFFDLMTDPVINTEGEIYQYVGDELVISWTEKSGVKNNNAVRCFFEIQKVIASHKEEFESNFGMVPEFKAGFHSGPVTVGELGIIKKDIVYSGDVLNTAARLMELCKEYEKAVLLSGEVKSQLMVNHDYHFEKIGALPIRGKTEEVEVYSMDRNQPAN